MGAPYYGRRLLVGVMFAGSELVTGTAMYMPLAVFTWRARGSDVLSVWNACWIGNLIAVSFSRRCFISQGVRAAGRRKPDVLRRRKREDVRRIAAASRPWNSLQLSCLPCYLDGGHDGYPRYPATGNRMHLYAFPCLNSTAV